jgi:hypothetical protein
MTKDKNRKKGIGKEMGQMGRLIGQICLTTDREQTVKEVRSENFLPRNFSGTFRKLLFEKSS